MVLSGVFMLTSTGQELRATDNLHASTRVFGQDIGITGWWRSRSLTVELEIDESLAIEQPVTFAQLPPRAQAQVRRVQQGWPLIKLEEVWTLLGHYYEAYFNQGGHVYSTDLPE